MTQQALNQLGGLPVERVVLISIVSLEEPHFTCHMSQSLPSLKYQVIVEASLRAQKSPAAGNLSKYSPASVCSQ